MNRYRLFFSWQNDRKDTKSIVSSALRKAAKHLATEGIELFIDQDTRERVGKRNIATEVLEKINNCDIFVADLTPVTTYYPPKETHSLPKHMPNSNVMYEYGYALRAKGENRMIALASIDKEADEHIEYMPFDINHDTITLFTDENSLSGLSGWIKKIIEDVDKERAAYVPQYACTLLFQSEEGLTDEITINPRYKRIYYTSSNCNQCYRHTGTATPVNWLDGINNVLRQQQALSESLSMPALPIATARIVQKTINYSYVPLQIVFINQGTEALDNIKIWVTADDDRVSFADTNEKQIHSSPSFRRIYDTSIDDKQISQSKQTLNPQDAFSFDAVYVHAPHDIDTFTLHWKLSSRQHAEEGEFTIHVNPKYEYDTREDDDLLGTESVEDCVEEKK